MRKRACFSMRIGTRTVRSCGRVSRSGPLSRSGKLLLTDSRTFSLCRSQSRAPRENSSYHGISAAMRDARGRFSDGSLMAALSLLRQQRGHVVERFARAVLIVAIFVHHPFFDG